MNSIIWILLVCCMCNQKGCHHSCNATNDNDCLQKRTGCMHHSCKKNCSKDKYCGCEDQAVVPMPIFAPSSDCDCQDVNV